MVNSKDLSASAPPGQVATLVLSALMDRIKSSRQARADGAG